MPIHTSLAPDTCADNYTQKTGFNLTQSSTPARFSIFNGITLSTEDTTITSKLSDNSLAPAADSNLCSHFNSSSTIYQQIFNSLKTSSGIKLPGTVSASWVKSLFQRQARPWIAIAGAYLDKVRLAVHEFTVEAHQKLMPDESIREILLRQHANHEAIILQEARSDLEKILKEQFDTLMPANLAFVNKLNRSRNERVLGRLQAAGLMGTGEKGLDPDIRNKNFSALLNAASPSWEDYIVQDMHDTLKAYYEVARDRFMDNIETAVVERHYTGNSSKLRLYSFTDVSITTQKESAPMKN